MNGLFVRHLLISTVFALAIALIVYVLKPRSAAMRYRLWLMAALKFAVPIGIFIALGRWLHGELIPASSYVLRFSGFLIPQHSGGLWVTPAVRSDSVWMILTLLWALGAGVCFGVWYLRWSRQSRPTTEAPPATVRLVADLQRRLGLHRPVKVRSALSGTELALAGVFNPVVVLPPALCSSLEAGELEAVLMHELVHAKRRDNLLAVVVHTLVCIFWFHPGLWWIEKRLMAERELACDEAVIDHGSPAEAYVAGILKICSFHLIELQPGACGVSGSGLQKRMEHIMQYTSKSKSRAARTIVAALGAMATGIPFLIGFSQSPALFARAKTQPPVKCAAGGRSYLEGAIIEQKGYQQMCVDALGKPTWVRTSPEMRQRGQSVTVLPPPKPFLCVPEASHSEKLCSCEGHGMFSPGAVVESGKGLLACAAGKWTAYQPHR